MHRDRTPQDLTGLYETVPCNLCGGVGYRIVYPAAERPVADLAVSFRSSGDEALKDQLVSCDSCGLQFVNPRLRPELILDGYREGTDEVFVSQAAARERTFARALDEIDALAPNRGRLLDVGTAAGSFLHVAEARGWKVSGCEPNVWLCEWGKTTYGLDIRPGTLVDQRFSDQLFDVVTVWDVLEHASDPRELLRECQRVLKPGGLLVLNCPDSESWIARVMGRRWPMLLTVHLYYFTRRTLGELLRRVGFDVLRMRPHIQWLELGYVLKRGEAAAGALARAAGRLASGLGLARRYVPYWIGQTRVIARKPR